jgi:hypothetical protein
MRFYYGIEQYILRREKVLWRRFGGNKSLGIDS